MSIERRFLSEPVIVETVGGKKKITGYAAKFNVRSGDLGGYVEEVDPKAFDRALNEKQDVRGLWNHDANYVLGRVKSGTLKLSVDSVGLKYEITPPNTTFANDLMESLDRGDVDQSSFAFSAVKGTDKWSEDKNGTAVRRLTDVNIWDVSPVTYPAYDDTTSGISLRSLYGQKELPVDIQNKIAEVRSMGQRETRYRGVLGAVAAQKWAIEPGKLETICALLNMRAEGHEATKEEIRAAMALQHGDTPSAQSAAVIPVYGVISQRMSMFDEFSGGTSCEMVGKLFDAAIADESVSAIVFDIDSPGGTVTGVPELAEKIRAARGQKPIIAVANGMAASAAYWIASQADQLVVIPSGEVGSVGVYTTHQDVSGAMEKQGVKITFVQAGAHKTEGNPYQALSEDARADMQDGVDKFYNMFTQSVADGRGVSVDKVLADFGQGRMKLAADAIEAGMADRVATLEEVLAPFQVAKEDTTGDEFTAPNPISETAMSANAEVRAAKKTKRVAGEDLPKPNFAYQGSEQLADWKLPIKFSDEAKTVTHIENAVSQWPKTDMPNATEKSKARSRIKAAARKHGVTLSPGDLAAVDSKEKRSDDDMSDDYCQCDCMGCTAGNCHACEADDCTDINCECCGFDDDIDNYTDESAQASASEEVAEIEAFEYRSRLLKMATLR